MDEKKYRTIRLESEDIGPSWDAFVESSPQGSIFVTSGWIRACEKILNSKAFIITIQDDKDRILAGFPVIPGKSRFGFRILQTPPLTPYFTIAFAPSTTEKSEKIINHQLELVAMVITELQEGGFAKIEFKCDPAILDIREFLWQKWEVWVCYTFIGRLNTNTDILSRFNYDIRRQVNKCLRENMQVKLSSQPLADLPLFYVLYNKTWAKQDKKAPRQDTIRFFLEEAVKRNSARMYLGYAENGELISGAIVLLSSRGIAHYWVAGTDPDFLDTGITPFMIYKIMLDQESSTFALFDFDGANIRSIAAFKNHFGGNLTPYFQLKYERKLCDFRRNRF